MQELRITLKVTVPIDDTDAFLMAQTLLDAKNKIDAFTFDGASIDLTSKLVSPRRVMAPDDSEVISLPQEQTAPVTVTEEATDNTVTDIRTAPWRRAVKGD